MGTSLYDLQSPSAISSLLAQLTGSAQPNVPLQGPQAAPLPPQPSAPVQQSLLQRVVSNLKGLPGAIEDRLTPKPGASLQAAVQAGLISPEEAQGATPGWLDRLALIEQPGGLAQLTQSRLGNLVAMKQMAQGIQQQRGIQQTRADIARLFPAPPNETPEQMDARLEGMYTYAVQHGDVELAKNIGDVVKETVKRPKAERGFEPQLFRSKTTGALQFMAPQDNRKLDPDLEPIKTGGSAGTPILFERTAATPKEMPAYVGVAPGDNDTLAKYSALGYKPRTEVQTIYTQGLIQDRFDAGRGDKAVSDYSKRLDTMGITKAAPVLNQALLTINDAKNNPDPRIRKALFASSIANFVQAADPKAQIRWQLLNYFKENINASAADRVRLLVKRLKDGTLPDDVLYGMAAHLQNVKKMMESEVAAERSSFLKSHPYLETDERLKDASALFPDVTGGQAPAASDPAGQYSPNNPFAKKKP